MSEANPARCGPVILRCFDLETTGVDVATCEVVQAAVVEAEPWPTNGGGINMSSIVSRSMLFYAANIPAGATAVHGITAEMVADCKPFGAVVRSFVQALTEPDVVIVTFNGCSYDIPIIARYLATVAVISQQAAETHLRTRHIDVMRLWWRARQAKLHPGWTSVNATVGGLRMPLLTSDMFAGSLTAAHGFYAGEGFDDAHNAEIDCIAALRVLHEMLCSGFVTVETAIKWSNEPLPGDVDFAGKFKWQGDRCVITIGKQAGTPIEQVERGFLQWMLAKDFPADTKDIVRRFLAGEYPQRRSET